MGLFINKDMFVAHRDFYKYNKFSYDRGIMAYLCRDKNSV